MKLVFISFQTILLTALFTIDSFSQALKSEITGKVVDKNQKAIEYAIVKLVGQTDSSSFLTNAQGEFFFRRLAEGSYRLKVSFVGYKSYSGTVTINKQKPVVNASTIVLEEGLNLNAVQINAEAPPVVVKKDTVEFNPSGFKTQPNASVEELLKKLPGLEVDKDGNIKTQGETITKVLVEGKEFFGSDPKIATKNLPADAIKKVQLIDDKSEKAKATGLDDGKREKILNLTLKDDKKKGTFGNASLSGGTESRYLSSLSLNHYNKQRQMNLLLLSNNVNQTGFGMEDANNFSGSSGGNYTSYSGGQRTVNGVNVAGESAGLNNTVSGGINYSDDWGKKKKTKFTGSYFAFGNSSDQNNQFNSQSFRPNGTFFSNSNSENTNTQETHRFSVKFSASPDSLTNIYLSPSLNFAFRNGKSEGGSLQTNGNLEKVTETRTKSSNKSFAPNLTGNYSINRQFRKQGGSLSLYVYNSSNNNNSTYWQESNNNYYQIKQVQNFNREDQRDYFNGYLSASVTLSKTISKDKESSVFFSPSYNRRTDNSSLDAYEYNPSSGFYEIRVDSLVNNSKSTTQEVDPSIGFNRSTKKWNLYATASLRKMYLKGYALTKGVEQKVEKDFTNFIPYFSFRYYPKKGTTLSSDINFYTSPPSISDLQALQNNTSPLYIRYGNPDLKASKYMYWNGSYRTSDSKKGTYTNVSLYFRKTFNAVVRSSTLDTVTGITYSKPINVDGNYNAGLNGNCVISTGIKNLRITPGFDISNSRNKGFIDNLPNNSDQITGGPTLNFSYSYKEVFEISFNNRSSYTWVHNSVSSSSTRDRKFYNFDNSGSVGIRPVKKWRINSDFTHRSYAQQQFVLLNAGIQHTMMKNDRLTLELKGFDLLNRNSAVNRYVSDTYIYDSRSNNLNRYFYLKLTYKVTKVGGSNSKSSVPPPAIIIDKL